jgi:hypothetical protein
MEPVYLRGLADLMQSDGISAATEFQKIIDYPGIVLQNPLGALARLGLARADALQRGIPAFSDIVERRRPRNPHPEGSQGGVREAEVRRTVL